MSARACLIAWNWPIGRPNCTRTLAYSEAVSRHQRATPAPSAAAKTSARFAHLGGGDPGQQRVGREGDVGEDGLAQAPGGVERRQRRSVGVVRIEQAPASVGEWRQQDRGRRQSEHRAQRPAGRTARSAAAPRRRATRRPEPNRPASRAGSGPAAPHSRGARARPPPTPWAGPVRGRGRSRALRARRRAHSARSPGLRRPRARGVRANPGRPSSPRPGGGHRTSTRRPPGTRWPGSGSAATVVRSDAAPRVLRSPLSAFTPPSLRELSQRRPATARWRRLDNPRPQCATVSRRWRRDRGRSHDLRRRDRRSAGAQNTQFPEPMQRLSSITTSNGPLMRPATRWRWSAHPLPT